MPNVLNPIRLMSAKALRNTLRDIDPADFYYAAVSFVDSDDLQRINQNDFNLNFPVSDSDEYIIRQNITTLHRVLAGGSSRVVRRIDWQVNAQYVPFRNNQRDSDNFYVVATEIVAGIARTNVYKCLYVDQLGLTPAQVPPTGVQQQPFSTPDGYWWKYLYTIPNSDAILFTTTDYIPVPERITPGQIPDLNPGTAAYDQYISQVNAQPGLIFYIEPVNPPPLPSSFSNVGIALVNGIDEPVVQEYRGLLSSRSDRWTVTLLNGQFGSGYQLGTTVITTDSDDYFGPAGTTIPWLQPQIGLGLGHGSNPGDELNSTTVMIVARNAPQDLTEVYFTNNFYTCNLMRNPIDQATKLLGEQQFYAAVKAFDLDSETIINPFRPDDYLVEVNPNNGAMGRVVLVNGLRTYYVSISTENREFEVGVLVGVQGKTTELNGRIAKVYPSEVVFGSGDLIILNKLPAPIFRSPEQTESLNFIVQY